MVQEVNGKAGSWSWVPDLPSGLSPLSHCRVISHESGCSFPATLAFQESFIGMCTNGKTFDLI